MLKKYFFVLSLFLLCLFVPAKAEAKDVQFLVAVDSTYDIKDDGATKVTQVVTITNKTEFYFTPSYTSKVGFSDVSQIEAFNQDGTIPATFDSTDSKNKSIKLTFSKRYAGLDKKNEFTIKFVTHDIAVKKGNIWEVSIPGIEDASEFETYKITINTPKNFGDASIIKPSKLSKKNSGAISFTKNEIGHAGIYMLYGEEQYYNFNLKYNISNPNLFPVKTEIAIPSSTNYQTVLINSFSEKPDNVTTDVDGNWIAEYRLLPQQKKTISVKGIVKIFSNPKKEELNNSQLIEYTSQKKYWDSKDGNIVKEAQELTSAEDIYNYVQKTLSYNRSKIATDNLRLGGKGALADSKNSVCLEFTDLFISLARAKGIPARAVEGYAYTSNSSLRPLSLVNDILHAWPEYYDKKEKEWVMVDPTWGNTTNGMNYFNTFDFSHFAFVIKGHDSEYPIPAGGYKFSKDSKDVDVNFAKKEDFKVKNDIDISETFPGAVFPKFSVQGTVTIRNKGNTSLKNLNLVISTSKGSKRQFDIPFLPPFGHKDITTSFSDVPFLTKDQYVITIQIDKKTYNKNISVSFIPDIKFLLILGGIIGVSTITAAITFHTGSLLVQRRKKKNSVRR